MENYNVDYYIKKFDAIPEDRWCIDTVTDEEGRHCAWGHLDEDALLNDKSPKIKSFVTLFKEFGLHKYGDPAGINNGTDIRYKQPTPKQRILAALYDIKAMQAVKEAETIINNSQAVEL